MEGTGQFAIRGGIIDIFPLTEDCPYRIELWDEEVDSIRSFNVQTQRSVAKVDQIRIMPNQEIIFPLEVVKKVIPNIKEDLKDAYDRVKTTRSKSDRDKLEKYLDVSKDVVEEAKTFVNKVKDY